MKDYSSASRRRFFLTLTLVFSGLLVFIALLLYFHGVEVTSDTRNRIATVELERSRDQARIFAQKVQEAIGRTKFSKLATQSSDTLLDFKRLTDMMMAQNSYVAYVHLLDENGETLLYNGPEAIQKVVFKQDSVTFMERTTEKMSFIRLDDAGVEEGGIHDISTIIHDDHGHGDAIGKLRIGLSQRKLYDYSSEAVANSPFFYYYVILILFGFSGAFALIWFHFKKVEDLEESLANEQRLAYVGGLASGLVHELRNPINSINLNFSLLEEDVERLGQTSSESMKRVLGRIKPGIAQLEKVSTEFLNFARPPEIDLKPVAVNRVVDNVLSFLSEELKLATIEVVKILDDSIDLLVTDEARLRQILINLLVNAIQAMPAGGTITVSTQLMDRFLKIIISDTGTGMSEQTREKLFSLFFTTKEGGVGLGLPIVKRMVADLHGKIEVSPLKGEGTTFTIVVPSEYS